MEQTTPKSVTWVTVQQVLTEYPNRKLSWAYSQLRLVRDCTGRKWVSVKDWEELGPGAVQA